MKKFFFLLSGLIDPLENDSAKKMGFHTPDVS
jgi:hypothetical protein